MPALKALTDIVCVNEKRRQLLQTSLFGALAAWVGGNVVGCGGGSDALGAGALRFDSAGQLIDAYPILINRGEGLWFDSGFVYLATTGDNRIWAYDVRNEEIIVLYDDDFFSEPILKGVDNLTV